MNKVILASASPRRKEILSEMGVDFKICPADIDESAVHEKSPKKLVMRLSCLKAEAVAKSDCVTIGADTVVAIGRKSYGKPHTEENARKMLCELAGRWHTVYTGVTVIGGGKEITFAVKSKVRLKNLTENEISAYVKEAKPLDKAGSYGIQDGGIVDKYRGSYTNIVGLPKEKLARTLAKTGVTNG